MFQGVGVAAPAGHHRPAQPAPALWLALVGWLGLEEQREGSLKAAEGRERPREIALFCLCVWSSVGVVLGLTIGLGGLVGVVMMHSDDEARV